MKIESALTPEVERKLWELLARSGDSRIRERLIENYLPFAKMLAKKFYARRQVREIEFEEFRQYACIGLIEAVDRYDNGRNANFKTFASYRITGAILNGVEKYNEKQQQITLRTRLRQERIESLHDKDGSATGKELFLELAEVAIGLALGYMLEGSGMYRGEDEPSTDTIYDRHELRQLKQHINRIVEALPNLEHNVIKYHYYQSLSFEEIGNLLEVTRGRVSQIHKQGLRILKELNTASESMNLAL